ncbi:MAG: 3-hydroxyacyl-CoA dehydrogenase / enoyl-CoA hydratase / 3-hydroxybutyryl-CoA epimerase [Pseudomonadota bacterium]|nr:3-hydroxyacyl-CoA dehydrogenase / enoyl-CoA hydratase / 3-hydroxybutyryl-CoA epimerase [Pseudomonadota bacterium]
MQSSTGSVLLSLMHWRLESDVNGIGWLCFDRQGAGANTLSAETMAELETCLDALEKSGLKGLVIHSGKARGFIAGADINEFPALDSEARAYAVTRQGQHILARLEALPFPSVAVLHGFALGGGLELALACTRRLAIEGNEPVFGLPEVQLGLHPGFGGTVRLTRLVGVRQAMDLMLTGRSIRPAQAKKHGLVDAVVSENNWRHVAVLMLTDGSQSGPAPWLDRLLAMSLFRPKLAQRLRHKVSTKAPEEHYPAPHALIALWEKHGGKATAAAYDAEAESFARLVMTPTSRNLVRVFFLRERLKKLVVDTTPAKRVHVIGAGVMGGDIAAWCALRGLEVSLQDRELKLIEPALERARKLFERKVRQPDALAAATARLKADPDGRGVAEADVVIEAVFEDLTVKRQLFARVEPQLKAGAILATNTSSIRLEDLGNGLKDPGRLIGLHFFNPVAKLPLVEVVAALASSRAAVDAGIGFTRQIGKLPLPCRSHPGFLVNRILAPYIAEALELLREGVPPAEIDLAATDFGMPMGPIELADSVGLDVSAHVARILAPVIGRGIAPEIEELVRQKHLGLKSGQGFYTYRERKPVRPALPPGSSDAGVQDRLILALLNEAANCLQEGIVADADLIDAGVIFGTGFAPFRGGPLHHARQTGVDTVISQLTELAARHGSRFQPSPGWKLLDN